MSDHSVMSVDQGAVAQGVVADLSQLQLEGVLLLLSFLFFLPGLLQLPLQPLHISLKLPLELPHLSLGTQQ